MLSWGCINNEKKHIMYSSECMFSSYFINEWSTIYCPIKFIFSYFIMSSRNVMNILFINWCLYIIGNDIHWITLGKCFGFPIIPKHVMKFLFFLWEQDTFGSRGIYSHFQFISETILNRKLPLLKWGNINNFFHVKGLVYFLGFDSIDETPDFLFSLSTPYINIAFRFGWYRFCSFLVIFPPKIELYCSLFIHSSSNPEVLLIWTDEAILKVF